MSANTSNYQAAAALRCARNFFILFLFLLLLFTRRRRCDAYASSTCARAHLWASIALVLQVFFIFYFNLFLFYF
jgi:hypothetical protein